MLKILSQCLPLLLLCPSFVMLGGLPSLAQTLTENTEESSSSTARAALPNLAVMKVLDTWVRGSYAQEEGNLELAREHFQNNKKQIEQIPPEKQGCFKSFNQILLEAAMTNQSPDFLKIESDCFDRVTLLLSVYSASQRTP